MHLNLSHSNMNKETDQTRKYKTRRAATNLVLKIVVSVQPILESKIGEDVCGLGNEHLSHRLGLVALKSWIGLPSCGKRTMSKVKEEASGGTIPTAPQRVAVGHGHSLTHQKKGGAHFRGEDDLTRSEVKKKCP